MRSILLPFLLCIATPAAAQEFLYVSSDGDEYRASENEHGGALTSLYPKARFIEAGAESRVVRGIETIYFGRSCDAFTEAFGQGTWNWSNGGFRVTFDNGKILGFPRQEIPWDSLLHCESR
ncbi:MAG: hypothetical protein OEM24_00405 [Paracoccaceae bacterium]|nr:hypothetical protein [Paracoccaceae bacterium]